MSKELRVYDTYSTATVCYVVKVKENKNLILSIETDEDSIYTNSDNKLIQDVPMCIDLDLDFNNTVMLCAAFIENGSTWFNNFKQYKLMSSGKLYNKIKTKDYTIEFEKRQSGQRMRSVLFMTILKDGKEVIGLNLTKTKIYHLLEWIRQAVFSSTSSRVYNLKDKKNFEYYIHKKDNAIGVNHTWIRNKEVTLLKNLIDGAVFNKNFGRDLESYNMSCRQVSITREFTGEAIDKTEIIVVFDNISIKEYTTHIAFTPFMASVLYLMLPEIEEYDRNKEVNTSLELETEIPTLRRLKENAKYITRINDNHIGIAIEDGSYDYKNNRGTPYLMISYPTTKRKGENKVKEYSYLHISLKRDWLRFFAYLTKVYSQKNELNYCKEGFSIQTFKFEYYEMGKNKKIEIGIFSIKNSKVNAVMRIKKISQGVREHETAKITLNRTSLGELIRIFIASAGNINGYYNFIKHHKDSERSLGIKNSSKSGVSFTDRDCYPEFKNLQYSDGLMLYVSAKNKILHGYWLAFQGEHISIDNDGYVTTLLREYDLNNDHPSTTGAQTAYKIISGLGFKDKR